MAILLCKKIRKCYKYSQVAQFPVWVTVRIKINNIDHDLDLVRVPAYKLQEITFVHDSMIKLESISTASIKQVGLDFIDQDYIKLILQNLTLRNFAIGSLNFLVLIVGKIKLFSVNRGGYIYESLLDNVDENLSLVFIQPRVLTATTGTPLQAA